MVGASAKQQDEAVLSANVLQSATQKLLENLCHGYVSVDKSPLILVDSVLNLLRDHKVLSAAQEKLQRKSQDKTLDVFFQVCISAMVGVLNIFLDPELQYIWRKASMVIVIA